MKTKLLMTSLTGLLVLMTGIFAAIFTPTTYAQPGNRTPRPTSEVPAQATRSVPTNSNPTGSTQAGTAEALATQRTGSNSQVNFQSTTNALLTQVPVGGNERPEMLAATAEVLATQASGFETVQLTATALTSQLTGQLSPEAIGTLTTKGNVIYDPNSQSLTVTYSLSETTLNAVLSAAITASGYEVYSITTDLVAGGAILTTVTPEGTSVIIMNFYLSDGSLYVDITAATLNNVTVPVQALDSLEASFNQALNALLSSYLPQDSLSYSLTGLTVTETALELTITLMF